MSLLIQMHLEMSLISYAQTDDNSTVVLSIKGTSAGLFGGGGPTVKKDKLNGDY